jgi:hypothetical protein
MRRLLFAAVLIWVPGLSLGARADINDLQIYKLGNPSASGTAGSNAASSFRMLSNELGISMAAVTLAPPTTIGEDGFAFAFEYTVAFVNGGATVGNGAQPYWVTAGGNPSVMQFPTLHFRKGLPYSLEVGGKVSAITNSSMFTGTVEAKWGLVEGFRYLPDLGVRFAMTRLFGEQDLNLTSGDLDFSLGKEFGVGGLLTLTPYAGYALLGVDSSSNVFLGNQTTITPTQYAQNPTSGQVLFAENTVGNNFYNRFFAGLRLRSNIVSVLVEFSYESAQSGDNLPVNDALYALSASLGLTF